MLTLSPATQEAAERREVGEPPAGVCQGLDPASEPGPSPRGASELLWGWKRRGGHLPPPSSAGGTPLCSCASPSSLQ